MPCSSPLLRTLCLVRMSASQNFIILQNEGLGLLSWNWLIAKSTRSQRPFPSYRQRESQEISTWLGCSSIPQPAPETPSTWYVGRRVYVKCKFEQLKHFACIVIKLSLGKKIVPFRAGIKTKWNCLQEEERGVQITGELINWTLNIDQIVVWFSY